MEISPKHPRAESLKVRERLIDYWKKRVVADTGLIAHGRGEAFDYILGESTIPPALEAIRAASAYLLQAKYAVISVNGNAAALAASDLVRLADSTGAKLEVNLFYGGRERLQAVANVLYEAGAGEVLGLSEKHETIPEVSSQRRFVDPSGIGKADVVLVPLEDGDRTEALVKLGKSVIAIDLNPLSRTSKAATVTVVDNLIRAAPRLNLEVERLKREPKNVLEAIVHSYSNRTVLLDCVRFIGKRLESFIQP